ncbi:unnamed protein product [Amoebophrya sp. A120]|nr:unnamed protein product [Amoebophrya sp. A120]|eukprot:GSA120T00015077001.1
MLAIDTTQFPQGTEEKFEILVTKCLRQSAFEVLPEEELRYVAAALRDNFLAHLDLFQWAQFLYARLLEGHALGEDGLRSLLAQKLIEDYGDDENYYGSTLNCNREAPGGYHNSTNSARTDGLSEADGVHPEADPFTGAVLDELEPVVEEMLRRGIFYEKPSCPFEVSGVRVLALLTEDDSYHPAVVVREVHDVFFASTKLCGEVEEHRASGVEDAQELNRQMNNVPPTTVEELAAEQERPGSRGGNKAKASKPKPKKSLGGGGAKSKKKTQETATRFFEVRFLEYGKTQLVKEENLILDDDTQCQKDEGEEEFGEGECELCRHLSSRITFHHLIPKSTHRRWLRRKKWPPNIDSVLLERHLCRGLGLLQPTKSTETSASGGSAATSQSTPEASVVQKNGKQKKTGINKNSSANASGSASSAQVPAPTRALLNCYGAMLCPKCHMQVHRTASNDILAVEFNSVAALLRDLRMQTWLSWKAK